MAKPSSEDWLFMQQEADKRARIRAQFGVAPKVDAERALVSERTGITGQAITDRIRAPGSDGESGSDLHLQPLVEVDWADGAVTSSERYSVLSAAQAHGIAPGSRAGLFLASPLEQIPSRTALDQILEVFEDLLHA